MFSASYGLMHDFYIATCLTSYTDEFGRTWILFFNEFFWFGTIMEHSLINPNQIQMTVMPVSDYPFDDNQKLGISHRKVFVPFNTDGTAVYFGLIFLTQRDITECYHIIMTIEMEWDPPSV